MSEEKKDPTSHKQQSSTTDEDLGYYFYPDRKGKQNKSFVSKLSEGRSAGRAFKCVSNIYYCARKDPLVKLMLGALKSHGCSVDLCRHISCEDCKSRVNGGFDPSTNQIVVCQNNSSSRPVACSVMAHELIHMFDYCRAKVDFKNLEHLACTEIRAANFMHCSFLSAMVDGDASPFNIKQRHKECVIRKAMMSVMMVRDVTVEEARGVVEKVFDKCYNDLEPFGRIPRRSSRDPERILSEGYLYGYSDS